jgi:hypothetical protein
MKVLGLNDSVLDDDSFAFKVTSEPGPNQKSDRFQRDISFSLFEGETLRVSALSEANGMAVASIPLPATLPLLAGAIGLGGIATMRRKSHALGKTA